MPRLYPSLRGRSRVPTEDAPPAPAAPAGGAAAGGDARPRLPSSSAAAAAAGAASERSGSPSSAGRRLLRLLRLPTAESPKRSTTAASALPDLIHNVSRAQLAATLALDHELRGLEAWRADSCSSSPPAPAATGTVFPGDEDQLRLACEALSYGIKQLRELHEYSPAQFQELCAELPHHKLLVLALSLVNHGKRALDSDTKSAASSPLTRARLASRDSGLPSALHLPEQTDANSPSGWGAAGAHASSGNGAFTRASVERPLGDPRSVAAAALLRTTRARCNTPPPRLSAPRSRSLSQLPMDDASVDPMGVPILQNLARTSSSSSLANETRVAGAESKGSATSTSTGTATGRPLTPPMIALEGLAILTATGGSPPHNARSSSPPRHRWANRIQKVDRASSGGPSGAHHVRSFTPVFTSPRGVGLVRAHRRDRSSSPSFTASVTADLTSALLDRERSGSGSSVRSVGSSLGGASSSRSSSPCGGKRGGELERSAAALAIARVAALPHAPVPVRDLDAITRLLQDLVALAMLTLSREPKSSMQLLAAVLNPKAFFYRHYGGIPAAGELPHHIDADWAPAHKQQVDVFDGAWITGHVVEEQKGYLLVLEDDTVDYRPEAAAAAAANGGSSHRRLVAVQWPRHRGWIAPKQTFTARFRGPWFKRNGKVWTTASSAPDAPCVELSRDSFDLVSSTSPLGGGPTQVLMARYPWEVRWRWDSIVEALWVCGATERIATSVAALSQFDTAFQAFLGLLGQLGPVLRPPIVTAWLGSVAALAEELARDPNSASVASWKTSALGQSLTALRRLVEAHPEVEVEYPFMATFSSSTAGAAGGGGSPSPSGTLKAPPAGLIDAGPKAQWTTKTASTLARVATGSSFA